MAKFKTRARALDMLGRQQIANASTAICELFKNAYDAYAEHAEVDYFGTDNLLIIRDDGVGMTKDEFENRWLVLGTESKLQLKAGYRPYRPKNMAERAMMGEKGIGRLAIALLGKQVLILTRAERDKKSHELVTCFIHWGVFEIPNIDLEDIVIPIRSISGGRLPTSVEIADLIDKFRMSIEKIKSKNGDYDFKDILNDLNDFQVDPESLDQFLQGLSLKEDGIGTHFYIAPANDTIAIEIDADRLSPQKDFSKFLLGFSNSTFAESPPPPVSTSFRYWLSDMENEDLIAPQEFFTKEELESSDHLISGQIDKYGQFKGMVRVYEEEHPNHVISWKESGGRPTLCGPFKVEFGYVQGAQRESRLAPDDWARLTSKLDNIGGLYVYRDRIRILPYGNSDVDWVNVELRRNKKAGYYFFSYRRIFGAVCLTQKANGELHEKAGREGFQQGKAYRQLKSILENLFIQLAADFFRDDKDDPSFYQLRKKELERLELARRKREKQTSTKRKALASTLESYFQKIDQGLPTAEINQLRSYVTQRLKSAATMSNPDEASVALLDAEQEANQKLAQIRESYRVARPRGVGLSRQLQRDWDAYCENQEILEREIFEPFSSEVANTLGKMASEARIYVDQRRRIEALIRQLSEEKRKAMRQEAGSLRKTASETKSASLRAAHEAIQDLQNTIAEVEADFARQNFSQMSGEKVEQIRRSFEQRIEEVSRKNTETLGKVRDMLASIAENLNQGMDISQIEMMEAMDEELQSLREQSDADAELVQLGLAVAVINHEFEAAIKGIRRTLRELNSWANANEDIVPLYQSIRNNFDHLDGHLNLFTPLQRRLYRNPIVIKGSEIHHYIKSLFDVRLKRHNVTLRPTDSFLSSSIHGYPSTIYPVFVNVIDNSLFWLDDRAKEREITLDADDHSFLIGNNGPGIPKRDYEAIFEQGFTRKPGGRGLGLFISRKALRKEGMDICINPSDTKKGVTFIIEWSHE